jgi:hypothetical protein
VEVSRKYFLHFLSEGDELLCEMDGQLGEFSTI